MARCKNTKRQRPSPKRGQSVPVSLNDFVSPSQTPSTPTATATVNGAASPTSATSENASASALQANPTPSVADVTSPSDTPVSERKSHSRPKTYRAERAPFLLSRLVGNKTGRMGIQEPGKSKKSLMSYCVDCVRPHLYVFCDGTKELKTHPCELHTREPNPLHWKKYYNEIRKVLDYRFQDKDDKKDGGRMKRPFTQPKLRHRYKCGHDKKSSDGDFDEEILAAMREMRRYEKKHGKKRETKPEKR